MGWLRIAVLVAVALVLAAAAYVCIGLGRAPIPGVAYSWRVTSNPRSGPLAESPDGKAFAYAVWNSNERAAAGFNSWPFTTGAPLVVSHSFDLYVYDLVARGAPRRVLRWPGGDVDGSEIVCWSPDGIVVRRGPDPWAPWLVDPGSGQAHPMVDWSQALLNRLSNDAHRIDTRVIPEHRLHPEEDNGRFFLWNPIAHRREWLFDLPLEYDGHPSRFAAREKQSRVENKYWASFHEVGDIRSTTDADSVHLAIFAFAREPGPTFRRYRLVVHVDVPDTSGWRDLEYASRSVLLDSLVVGCPPDTVTLRRGYAIDRLAGYVRSLPKAGRQVADGVWTTAVRVELEALPLSGPAATAPRAPERANHMNAGVIEVPIGPGKAPRR